MTHDIHSSKGGASNGVPEVADRKTKISALREDRRAGLCSIEGCDSASRSPQGWLCEKHYYRGRRTGSFEDRQRAGPTRRSNGYWAQAMKGHPAASPDGTLYEHRRVFYEAHGTEGHTCHWCGVALVWGGSGNGKVQVDHLDGIKANNEADNLVPSCFRCNAQRGVLIRWLVEHGDDPLVMAFTADAQVAA